MIVPPMDLLTELLVKLFIQNIIFAENAFFKKKSKQKSVGNVQFQQQF